MFYREAATLRAAALHVVVIEHHHGGRVSVALLLDSLPGGAGDLDISALEKVEATT